MDAVKLTLKLGFICPFVVIDPTNLGATIVVAQSPGRVLDHLHPIPDEEYIAFWCNR